MALSLALLLPAGSAADFVTHADSYCGGDCNTGNNAQPRHGCNYAFMGDLSLPACEAKCAELGCPCFDYSDPTDKGSVRPDEHCRVCAPTQTFLPVHASKQHYTVYQPLPSVWAPAVLTLALLAAVYLGAGAAYRINKLGKRGTAALPHAAFFQELQGLVADGVALVRGRQRAGYSQVGRSGVGQGETSAEAGKRSRGKKEKAGQKKERRPEPEPEPERHRKSRRERREAPAPPSAAEGGGESEAGAAKSAAAGGGGRWVHVAN